ncbi:MAG TPA: YtxH domain-containing protein [Acidimicrobiia bacterium]
MKFKSGLTIGIAVGYVLGARAGRERYEQIKRGAGAARRHPAVAQLGQQATGLTDLMRSGVAGGLEAGSRSLRETVEPAPPTPLQVNAQPS